MAFQINFYDEATNSTYPEAYAHIVSGEFSQTQITVWVAIYSNSESRKFVKNNECLQEALRNIHLLGRSYSDEIHQLNEKFVSAATDKKREAIRKKVNTLSNKIIKINTELKEKETELRSLVKPNPIGTFKYTFSIDEINLVTHKNLHKALYARLKTVNIFTEASDI